MSDDQSLRTRVAVLEAENERLRGVIERNKGKFGALQTEAVKLRAEAEGLRRALDATNRRGPDSFLDLLRKEGIVR